MFQSYTLSVDPSVMAQAGTQEGCLFMCDRLQGRVEFVKSAEDASDLWLKLKLAVHGCPEVYFCACYMPIKPSVFAQSSPYQCLQEDVLKYQIQGAQILI